MSFPRYERYKDSEVEWLGEVPEHWEFKRLKQIADVRLSNVDKHSVENQEIVSLCNYVDVYKNECISSDIGFMRATASDEQIARLSVLKGDVIITKDSESPADIGVPALVIDDIERLVCGYHLALIRPVVAEGAFLHFLFRSNFVCSLFEVQATGMTRYALSKYSIENLAFAVPPITEQQTIASFLNHETAKIDALIAEQQRLIALLTEKRQAVISHAVTKGLNPDAPMKDSGIEWLGEVPEHWAVRPLKYLVTFQSGGTPNKANTDYWDGDVPWASAKDLKTEVLVDTEDHITIKAIEDGAAYLVPQKSVLIVVRGMILAHTFPVVIALTSMAINQDLKALQPNTSISSDFLAWVLRGSSRETIRRVDEAGHGTKALRMADWISMQLPLPPIEEQENIIKHLERILAELDNLRNEAQKAITFLQERRTALISAAVTGEIDVRNLSATQPQSEVHP